MLFDQVLNPPCDDKGLSGTRTCEHDLRSLLMPNGIYLCCIDFHDLVLISLAHIYYIHAPILPYFL